MSKKRIDNFSAGPATLPKKVLEKLQNNSLNWKNLGFSAFECSHRDKNFIDLEKQLQKNIRQLMKISDDYEVLFMHGGATTQFASIPMNICESNHQSGCYIVSGAWSKKAKDHAEKYCTVKTGFNNPTATKLSKDEWAISPDCEFVHYCTNESISGLESYEVPNTNTPIISDMSSTILSREFDINKFDLVYAGTQKNLGIAGLAIVIVHKNLLNKKVNPFLPDVFNYTKQAQSDSMLNTPPTMGMYITSLVLEWVMELGGMEEIEKRNRKKALNLYSAIDDSNLYLNNIATENRSLMNIPFFIEDVDLQTKFLKQAQEKNLYGLKGHSSIGGIRASIYNAMEEESVERLIDFMNEFNKKYT